MMFGLLAFVHASDLFAVVDDSTGYPFGWEGGGIVYSSKENYVATGIIELVLSMAMVIAALAGPLRYATYGLLAWICFRLLIMAVDYETYGLIPFSG